MPYFLRNTVAVAFGIFLVAASFAGAPRLVYADVATSVAAGSASSGSGSAFASPADQLPDVVAHPADAISADKAAFKLGWPIGLLAAAILLGRGAGLVGRKFTWLAWIGKGTAAVVTAGIVTVAAAAYNALILGGSWYAAALASATAGFALLKPHVAPQPAQSS